MKTAILFPGQGSQSAGMGRRLLDFPQVISTIEECADATNLPLVDYVLHTPDTLLLETERAQPAIFALSVGVARVLLDKGIRPVLFAGHSLGHFSALAVAGVIELTVAAKLVASRGEIMSRADQRCPGGMAVVQNISAEAVMDVLKEAGLSLWVANCNLYDQIVISGCKKALKSAKRLFGDLGGRWTQLNVSGAFHSPLLDEEAAEFSVLIDDVEIRLPSVPVLCNSNGSVLESVSAIREDLKSHMTSLVRWVAVMDKLSEKGITLAIESGPGNILKGLMMHHDRNIQAMSTITRESINRAIKMTTMD